MIDGSIVLVLCCQELCTMASILQANTFSHLTREQQELKRVLDLTAPTSNIARVELEMQKICLVSIITIVISKL